MRCGKKVEPTGFFADLTVDALCLPDCGNAEIAYSLAEALRVGASDILEMDLEDLQIVALPKPGSEKLDVLLYDPMPGGSGLLDQMCERFKEVVAAAVAALAGCESRCERACIDCLQTFRNAFYHPSLNRHVSLKLMETHGTELVFEHDIPPKMPAAEPKAGAAPTNATEEMFRTLLKAAGFPEPQWQNQIQLGKPLGTTTPDAFYPDDDDPNDGICIYVDGMSVGIHGNPATAAKDRAIRESLRSQGYEVIEITASQLSDRGAMVKHFARLAKFLIGKERSDAVKADTSWFERAAAPSPAPALPFRKVTPTLPA